MSSWPLPQSLTVCVEEGWWFKKSALCSHNAVEANKTRSVAEGGRGGRTGADEPQPTGKLSASTKQKDVRGLEMFIHEASRKNHTRFEGVFAKGKRKGPLFREERA